MIIESMASKRERTLSLLPAFAVLCVLAAGACGSGPGGEDSGTGGAGGTGGASGANGGSGGAGAGDAGAGGTAGLDGGSSTDGAGGGGALPFAAISPCDSESAYVGGRTVSTSGETIDPTLSARHGGDHGDDRSVGRPSALASDGRDGVESSSQPEHFGRCALHDARLLSVRVHRPHDRRDDRRDLGGPLRPHRTETRKRRSRSGSAAIFRSSLDQARAASGIRIIDPSSRGHSRWTMDSMAGRQPPHRVPAPQLPPTSSAVRAPSRTHSRMVRSQTRRQ